MPLNQTSIYTLLSDQERIDLFVGKQIVSRLHSLLQLSPSLFKVCEPESWWTADDEKKFSYEFLDKSLKLWPDVENVAAGFAGAAYLHKGQSQLIYDFATMFVANNGRKMAEVFVCETAGTIFELEDDLKREMALTETLRNELPLGMPWSPTPHLGEDDHQEIEHHINTRFRDWGQNFLLDLLKWKKPEACADGDAQDDPENSGGASAPPG